MNNPSQFEEQQLKKLAVESALEFSETKSEAELEAFIDFVTAHVITHIKYQLVENNTKHTEPTKQILPVGATTAEADWHKWSVEQPLIKKTTLHSKRYGHLQTLMNFLNTKEGKK